MYLKNRQRSGGGGHVEVTQDLGQDEVVVRMADKEGQSRQ